MNYLFVLAFVAAGFGNSMSHEQHKHTEPYGQFEMECAKETNVSMAALAEAEDGIFTEQTNIHKFNCFAECLFYKLGFFTPGSNVLNIEEVRKQAMKKGGQPYVEIAEKCSKHEEQSLCDRSFEMYKCYYIEVNKLGTPVPTADVVGFGKASVAPFVDDVPLPPAFGRVLSGAVKEAAPADATGIKPADTPAAAPVFSPESAGRPAAEYPANPVNPVPAAEHAAAPGHAPAAVAAPVAALGS